jgi:hypothetical protein
MARRVTIAVITGGNARLPGRVGNRGRQVVADEGRHGHGTVRPQGATRGAGRASGHRSGAGAPGRRPLIAQPPGTTPKQATENSGPMRSWIALRAARRTDRRGRASARWGPEARPPLRRANCGVAALLASASQRQTGRRRAGASRSRGPTANAIEAASASTCSGQKGPGRRARCPGRLGGARGDAVAGCHRPRPEGSIGCVSPSDPRSASRWQLD